VVAYDQVESVWPVTGSVLIHDGVLYCTAGRSSYLDGGMRLYALDPATGRKLSETHLYSRDPETGRQPEERMDDVELPGTLPDVLATDGESLFLRDVRLSFEGEELPHTVRHIYSSVGFLDDDWWHRTYWIYGTQTFGRASGWAVVANHVPSGRLLVSDGESIYGFGRERVGGGDRGLMDVSLQLFRADKDVQLVDTTVKNNNAALVRRLKPSKVQYHWQRPVPLVVRAMVVAGDRVFIAGPTMAEEGEAAPDFSPDAPALLLSAAGADGRTESRLDLPCQPVHDGMVAAQGKLFLSLADGRLICLAGG